MAEIIDFDTRTIKRPHPTHSTPDFYGLYPVNGGPPLVADIWIPQPFFSRLTHGMTYSIDDLETDFGMVRGWFAPHMRVQFRVEQQMKEPML